MKFSVISHQFSVNAVGSVILSEPKDLCGGLMLELRRFFVSLRMADARVGHLCSRCLPFGWGCNGAAN